MNLGEEEGQERENKNDCLFVSLFTEVKGTVPLTLPPTPRLEFRYWTYKSSVHFLVVNGYSSTKHITPKNVITISYDYHF